MAEIVFCYGVATKTILFSEDTIYCHFFQRETLHSDLGRPSRSDLVLFQDKLRGDIEKWYLEKYLLRTSLVEQSY